MFKKTVHVYHHYESPPCETCGYRSDTGYFDRVGLNLHILHIVEESDILLERVLRSEDTNKEKK